MEGANRIGYHFLGRDSKKLKLQIFDSDPEFWEALVEFPFDSLRKRMSIIFKNEKTGKYILITKGADSVMFPRIKKEINIVPTEAKLNDFAREGLRTLVIAQKEMNEREFNEFWNEYQYLKVSSEKSKKRKLLNLYDLYEKHLDLVGVTGIEDKLQDGVPAAIYKLLEADIKIWVLTGDKQVFFLNNIIHCLFWKFIKETAIEIGKSCHLIQPDMDLIILTSSDAIEVGQKILKKCEQYVKKF